MYGQERTVGQATEIGLRSYGHIGLHPDIAYIDTQFHKHVGPPAHCRLLTQHFSWIIDIVYQVATSDLLSKLQRLQNRALRIITRYDDIYQNTTAMHQSLRILPLSRRRYVHTNNFAYKRSIQPKYVDNRNLLTRAHGKKRLLCPRP